MEEKKLGKENEETLLAAWAEIVVQKAREVGEKIDKMEGSLPLYTDRFRFQNLLAERAERLSETEVKVVICFINEKTWCVSGMVLRVYDFRCAHALTLFSSAEVTNYLYLLLKKGLEWQNAVRKIVEGLDIILSFAREIHRNILYPEVEEMEKEIKRLAAQLAEKEKEIEILRMKTRFVRTTVERAIIALDQTKRIFKSKTIERIRLDLIGSIK